MPSLLDKVKSKLGLNKSNLSQSSGHTLGGSTESHFDVTFTEDSLGLTIHSAPSDHTMCGSPMVVDVVGGSAASTAGVRVGDIIVSVESNSGHITYGDFVEVVQAIGRPVTLRFLRCISNLDSRKKAGASTPVLSAGERESQRQAMREAALAREKAWDKRVSSAASTRRRKTPDASGSVDAAKGDTDLRNAPPPLGRQLSEDEMASVAERARQSEQKTIDALGYNPFAPHFSSNSSEVRSQVSTACVGSSISASTAPGAIQMRPSLDDVTTLESQLDAETIILLNAALFELGERKPLGLPPDESNAESRHRKRVCVDTALKMLSNIHKNPTEPKFNRVAEVEGGLETMMGGGFELHETEEETFLQWNPSGSQHDGDLRLAYTINRLMQLKSELEGDV